MLKHNFSISLFRKAPWIVMALCLLIYSCADNNIPTSHTPITHNEAYNIWPDSININNGLIIRAISDSTLQVRMNGNTLRSYNIPPIGESNFSFKSDFPIIDALYRFETSTQDSTTWRFLRPYEIALNPLNVGMGIHQLQSRLKNDYVVPYETSSLSWPVVNDNPAWLLAACELYNTSGNRRWLNTISRMASNAVAQDCRMTRNTTTGLFFGIPRYLAIGNCGMPQWMTPSDLFTTQSFGVNATYWCAINAMNNITLEMARKNERSRLPEIPIDADSLRHIINREFWLPGTGFYSAMLYGSPLHPTPVHSSDNLAQGLAMIFNLTGSHIAHTVIEKTPTQLTGIRLLTPAFTSSDETSLPLTQAVWTIATAQHGDNTSYETSLGGLLFSAAHALLNNSQSKAPFRNTLSSVIIRGFAGMKFAFNGIYFHPSIPDGMPGDKHINGIRYRKSTLNITISGTGKEIASFSIDGKICEPFFPANFEGEHQISITLTDKVKIGRINIEKGSHHLPDIPLVEWTSNNSATILPTETHHTHSTMSHNHEVVIINGTITSITPSHSFSIPATNHPTWVQITGKNEKQLIGFSSKPHLIVPSENKIILPLNKVASTGTKVLTDKQMVKQFIESDHLRNRNIKLIFIADAEGDYLIDVHYLQALGIVNPRRKMALRMLSVNGIRSGIFMFPQLQQKNWDKDMGDSWQSIAVYSNPLKVHLTKGENRIELRFYQPNPVFVDPSSNSILADHVRIIRL